MTKYMLVVAIYAFTLSASVDAGEFVFPAEQQLKRFDIRMQPMKACPISSPHCCMRDGFLASMRAPYVARQITERRRVKRTPLLASEPIAALRLCKPSDELSEQMERVAQVASAEASATSNWQKSFTGTTQDQLDRAKLDVAKEVTFKIPRAVRVIGQVGIGAWTVGVVRRFSQKSNRKH